MDQERRDDATRPSQAGPSTGGPMPPSKERWRSEELLGNRCEILIEHEGEVYRLRRTRQGKLILYK